jgi:hypothetical protein
MRRPHRLRRSSSRAGSIDLCGRATTAAGSRRDDPRCLIEAYFAGRYGEHDPDTVVIAWLSILPAGIEPAGAARSLVARLGAMAPERLSGRQRRLVDLLLHVSRRGRVPSERSTTTRRHRRHPC